jgi:quinol monooxygenase YgiN
MIHVVAILVAKPGQRAALLEALHGNVETVRAETGCLEYSPVIDAHRTPSAFGPDTLLVIEKWATEDALAAHAKSPHMAAYAAATRELVASRAIHVLQPA